MSEEKQNAETVYVNMSTVVGDKQIKKKGVKVLDSKQRPIKVKSIDRSKLKTREHEINAANMKQKDEKEEIDVDKEIEF